MSKKFTIGIEADMEQGDVEISYTGDPSAREVILVLASSIQYIVSNADDDAETQD